MWVEVLTMAGRKDVLIVRVLLPIIIDLALRSKTQGRIEVLRMREHSVLEGMATRAEAFIRDFGLWSQVFSRYSYNAGDAGDVDRTWNPTCKWVWVLLF